MSYLKKKWKAYVTYFLLFLSFNLYYLCLMKDRHVQYLLYIDFLLLVFLGISEGGECISFYKKENRKRTLLQQEELSYQELTDFENSDIAEHDVRILGDELQKKFNESCEIQDYVAKWCHEFKIPLAASLLMAEKIRDAQLRTQMRGQLERMNWQISTMLQGCRLQSPLFDLQIKETSLEECVRASIQNNRFFLIQEGFSLSVDVKDVSVYTDRTWLVYILDQLINNAVKYVKAESEEAPALKIRTNRIQNEIELVVEDSGEGIRDCDIRRIFDKGFTGSNYHNGKYKSTGMGLYLAEKIADRLGHRIQVESKYGEYTRFHVIFAATLQNM